MKTNLLLLSAAALVSTSAMGAAKVPSYKSLDFDKIGLATQYLQGNANFVDVNNDGYYDLLLKGRDMARGWAPQVALSLGSENGLTTTKIIDDDAESWQRVLTYLDYNNDGNLDFILGQDRGNILFTGDGKGNFVKTSKEDFVFNDGYGLEAAETPDTYMVSGLSEAAYDGITVVADFNRDGISDVLCYNSTETTTVEIKNDQGEVTGVYYNIANIHPAIFLGNGDGTFTVIDETGMDPLRAGTFSVADFDRDGILDVVANGWLDSLGDGALRLYKGNGDGTFTAMAEVNATFDAAPAGAQKGRVLFVDINGDGYADIFQSGETFHNQQWGVYSEIWINNNGTSFTQSTFDFAKQLVEVKNSGADWADVNNDGLMDLVFAGADASGAISVVAINEGNGTFNFQDEKIMGTRSGVSVVAVDFDEDGVVDIATLGYNGTQNFNIYTGSMKSRKDVNSAPTAPANLAMEANDASVTFSWDAATDEQTPAAALLYNVYVKTNDGKLHFNVLADAATGHLRNTHLSGAICTTSYTMNIDPATIAEWGVQAIDGAKWTSEFAIYGQSGIEGIAADDVNAPAVYYNMQGVRVNNPENGIFIEVKNGKAQKVQF